MILMRGSDGSMRTSAIEPTAAYGAHAWTIWETWTSLTTGRQVLYMPEPLRLTYRGEPSRAA